MIPLPWCSNTHLSRYAGLCCLAFGFSLALAASLSAPSNARAPDVSPGLKSELLPQLEGDCQTRDVVCTWEEVIGGRLDDEAHAAVEMRDGGFVLAGHTRSHGVLNRDAWVLRLDGQGKVIWQKVFGGPLTEKIFGIAAVSDGGVVIVGKTYSVGDGGSDVLVVRFGADGEILWQKTYGGPHNDGARAILALQEGRLLIVGSQGSEIGDDAWIMALDRDGEMLWNRKHGTVGEDGAVSVARALDGGFAIAGYSQRPGLSRFDTWIIRLTSDGRMLWQRHFPRGIFSAGTGVTPAPDGGFFISGISQTRSPRTSRSWVIRLAPDGNTVWKILSRWDSSNEAWGLDSTEDGGVIVVSAAKPEGIGRSSARLVRLSADGDIVWSRLLGGATWDRPTAVISTRDGGVLITGYTTGRGSGYQDVWVVRLNSEGKVEDP